MTFVSITNTFIKKYGVEYGKANITISDKVVEVLMRHSWPGNITSVGKRDSANHYIKWRYY